MALYAREYDEEFESIFNIFTNKYGLIKEDKWHDYIEMQFAMKIVKYGGYMKHNEETINQWYEAYNILSPNV